MRPRCFVVSSRDATEKIASVRALRAAIDFLEAKHYYDYWRPVTDIRAADADGNLDTVADPDWHDLVFIPLQR